MNDDVRVGQIRVTPHGDRLLVKECGTMCVLERIAGPHGSRALRFEWGRSVVASFTRPADDPEPTAGVEPA